MFRIFLPEKERNMVGPRRHTTAEAAFGIIAALVIVGAILLGGSLGAAAHVIQVAFSSG